MKRFVLTVAVVSLLGSLWSARSQACSPPQPGFAASVPADGTSYPANGYLLFEGYGINLDAVTVTVDGSPATLVQPADSDPLARLATLVARVEPEPMPGQLVEIGGSFCSDAQGNCAASVIVKIDRP